MAGDPHAHAASKLAQLLGEVILQERAAGQATPGNAGPPAGPAWGAATAMEVEAREGGGQYGPRPPPLPSDLGAYSPSYVCGHCGGIVAAARREVHEQLWCAALDTG